ncbi:MAG TPA: RNA polymerase factor sigma-54 [Chitinophagales bacterium]|jgi:RNA polymerase sigma-54 factor|nr:RNA polymerase factor sigma-54 [Chitinophagales bacterium]MBP6155020.1 RNA polymerase factor sigma-54 [Chitinophagales bacterium]HQV78365.1 RNA polymerase factor sigma-54 [Chitinophagales bacterium]HQW79516.1 RNA polymerase factor sigma-54 [Chitinophagales bacterium]HRB19951.1 RNA polymerase factor sigma-54 [Chitinophagales bacterium]
MLHQRLSQKMLQKLSPQQIQLMKLLQVPTASLEQRIKEELEINPALEENMADFDSDKENLAEPEQIRDDENEEYENNNDDDFADSLDVKEYTKDEYDYDGDSGDEYRGKEEKKSTPYAVGKSFHDFLDEQLNLLDLDEHEWQIADQLIGSIGDDGYLRRDLEAIVDDLAFQKNLTTDVKEIEEVLRTIHRFDPSGVGARNLQECLQVQLERKEQNTHVKVALEIINTQFEAFTKKHYDKLMKALNINEEQLKKSLDVILHLNPKPGGSSDNTTSVNHQTIIPDFTVENNNGELDVLLNGKNAPDLRISDSFKEMLTSYGKGAMKDKKQKEAVVFIKQKIDSAKWFIDAIKQRQHTLFVTMEAIVEFQKEYFLSGDEMKLRPMILKDIAEITSLDISTVSRVANSKYCQTEFGVFSLKHFFSEGLQTESGEEVSTREVKKILEDLVAAENKSKPLSDEYITEQLKEKGYNIARRTVAKYREQLNIPVARLRKEL